MKNLSIEGKKWKVNGKRVGCLLGRDSFKLANMLSLHYTGHGGWEKKAHGWVDFNQGLLGEAVVLRVFGETGAWEGHPMFGAEPADQGIWDHELLHRIVERDSRITNLSALNKKVIRWLVKKSHDSGVIFEYCVDATLKGVEGFNTGITDHAIRQTAMYFRRLIEGWDDDEGHHDPPYPNAKIIIEARNEWRAHNAQGTKWEDVNMWAHRFYRWGKKGEEDQAGFTSPGSGWIPHGWPEGHIIVSGTLSRPINVGRAAGAFKMSLDHPERNRERWWELPETYEQLVDEAHGVPYGYNESIMCVDVEDEDRIRGEATRDLRYGAVEATRPRWYGKWAYTHDLEHYLQWLETCKKSVDYFIIHDEVGMCCRSRGDDPELEWPRPLTRLESALSGSAPPPPPPPPPPKLEVTYKRMIKQAFMDILGRQPHPTGIEAYDKLMREGLTEAGMREAIMRGPEFAKHNRE